MEIDYTKVVADVSKEIAKDAYNDVAHPAAQNAGGILGTVTGFFNHVVLYPLKKLNIKYEQKAISFQRELEKKYEEVPVENRVEPQINIVGPTLESLKYNIMEDDLAEMFSNLLVSNMDKTTQGLCTPSFVKVIEQLTPNDARLFQKIHSKYHAAEDLALCTIIFSLKEDPTIKIRGNFIPKYFTNIIPQKMVCMDISRSLQNLERLGLIEFDFTHAYTKQEIYENILNGNDVTEIKKWAVGVTNKEYNAVIDNRGVIQLNNFSHDFAEVCLGVHLICEQ